MAEGKKTIETRSWTTGYRGDLAICSSKHKPSFDEFGGTTSEYYSMLQTVPFGKVLCVVELYDVWNTSNTWNKTFPLSALEIELGDYSPGRFGWMTKNLRKLPHPISVTGKQGLFDLPPDVAFEVIRQLNPEGNIDEYFHVQ